MGAPRDTLVLDAAIAGDVIIRQTSDRPSPAFVVRCMPGPDQFGCATLAKATRLAQAFAATVGVDVWLDGRDGRVTAIARFRGLGRRAALPASAAPSGGSRALGHGAHLARFPAPAI